MLTSHVSAVVECDGQIRCVHQDSRWTGGSAGQDVRVLPRHRPGNRSTDPNDPHCLQEEKQAENNRDDQPFWRFMPAMQWQRLDASRSNLLALPPPQAPMAGSQPAFFIADLV
jgi:hypothetical protein